MRWLRLVGLAGASLALLGAAACGGDDDDDDAAAPADGDAIALKVTQDAKFGSILTSADGLTLYTFTQDTPGKSTCSADCAATWPPLITTAANAPALEGAKGEFSLIARDDGSKQVAFNGRPLYRFAADKQIGDATGEGVGGVWFVAKADGSTTSAGSAVAPTPGGGGGAPDYNY